MSLALEEDIQKARRPYFHFGSAGTFWGNLSSLVTETIQSQCFCTVARIGFWQRILEQLEACCGELVKRATNHLYLWLVIVIEFDWWHHVILTSDFTDHSANQCWYWNFLCALHKRHHHTSSSVVTRSSHSLLPHITCPVTLYRIEGLSYAIKAHEYLTSISHISSDHLLSGQNGITTGYTLFVFWL